MRIGIVGAAGTGKTTLARELAAALGIPLIPDFVPAILREHGKESWREVRDFRLRRIIRFAVIERKIAAERAAEAFVSDRTVIDYLAYWLHNQAEHEPHEQNLALVEMVRGHLGRYDRCVFLPFREAIEGGTYRNVDPIHNLRIAAQKRGLMSIFGLPLVDAPFTFGEDVQAWIARWLAPAAGGPAVGTAVEPEPELAPIFMPAPAPEVDEAAMIERVLEQARLEFAKKLERPAGEDVGVLDRRIEKLAKALAEMEEKLRASLSGPRPDAGVASIYKTVQGIADDAPDADRKKGFLKSIFMQSLEVKTRLAERKAAEAAAAAAAPTVAENPMPAAEPDESLTAG